jgi:hypothetical protein
LWHSEEDSEDSPVFGQRFDKLRLFIFRAANGHKACGFIYPDLLPGPTFGWQDDNFVQAIDTLHVRSVEFENGAITPNTLTWLSLYLGTLVSRKALCEATLLGPFYGGYSLTAAYKKDGRVSVEKVEFANDQAAACELETTTGKTFFQTNVIRDLSQPIGAEELTSPESRAWNEKRMARAARFIKVIQKSAPRFAKQIATRSGSANRTGTTTEEASDPRDHSHVSMVFRMMQSRLGDESANSNRDVKAYLVCHMSTEKTSIWVGPGAPVSGDELFSFEM